jgi:hypothetical protein
LALAILLYVLVTLYQYQQCGRELPLWRLLVSSALFSLILGLLNPFSLPTLLLPVGIWWIVRSVQARRVLWKEAFPIIVMGLTSLPLVIYNAWTFSRDPFWGVAYGSQNYQISYPLDVVLIGYGVMSVLAFIGARRGWRTKLSVRFLTFWVVVVWLMGYIPVNYQRRFSLGLAPILAVLAVPGWQQVAQSQWLQRWRQRIGTRVLSSTLVVLLLWGQNITFYSVYAMSYFGRGPMSRAVFQPRALVEAAEFLETQGDEVVVLTCENIGNILAGEIPGRVVLGHAGATLDVEKRRGEVSQFFDDKLSPEAQHTLLEAYNVTHILTADIESLRCGSTFEPDSRWGLAFVAGNIEVYSSKKQ